MKIKYGAALIAALFFASSAQAGSIGVNQLLNPGMEAPVGDNFCPDSWSCFNLGGGTNGAFANSGAQALKLFGPFFGTTDAAGASQTSFSANPGETWTASAFALTATGDSLTDGNFGAVQLIFRDAGNGITALFEDTINASATLDVWTLLSATGVAPANTVSVDIFLLHVQLADDGNPFGGGAVYFDDASLSQVPVPAAVWLMLSGIGTLVGFRRKMA